jgi:hypothetical protein
MAGNITTTIMFTTALCTAAFASDLKGNNMPEIRFDIGRNILEIAKASGAPRYSTRDVAGWISYKIIDLPPDIAGLYLRTGYQITASPLFALTLYADEENHNNLAVEAVALQFSTDAIKSHESAQVFVEHLISQFEKGKWVRYIDEICPSVTGRSSFLNEAGEPEQIGSCPLDPRYRLTTKDWVRMMQSTQNYKWVGEGVLATLTVGYSDNIGGVTYTIDLEFDDFAIKKRRTETKLAQTLAAGDTQGRNSTAKERGKMVALKARITVLEKNAIKRGDKVIGR